MTILEPEISNEIISTQKLVKTYGKGENAFHALKGVDLRINKGERVAIIGKSGSGKSTLMHLLSLMDVPSSGVVKINNKDASSFSNKALDKLRNKTFGFVFQQFFLNGNASVLENVVLPLKISGMSVKERNLLGEEALAAVGLSDKSKKKARTLSGGQKQRVVIARAIVNKPDCILADEFTGSLDSTTSATIEDLLFGLNETLGVTLIIITHDEELAAKCERQIIIKDGEIVTEDKS